MQKIHKVCHIMRRLSFKNWGGVESSVLHTCQYLISKGVESPIFCTKALSKEGIEMIEGVEVRRFNYFYPWLGLSTHKKELLDFKGGNAVSLSLLTSLLKEPHLSLIHAHTQNRLGATARTVARLRGIPYIVSLHGGHFLVAPELYKKMQEPFKNHLEWGKILSLLLGTRRVLKDADAIITISEDERNEVLKRYPEKKVFCLPNGIDVEKYEKADPELFRKAQGLNPTDKFILSVSRIDFDKNQILLVRAFARFVKKFPNYRLVLIGPITEENYYQTILETIEKLGVSSFIKIIPGYTKNDPLLMSAYHAADFFVLPSLTESFGIVILEAWATGLPVIASRVGGIPSFTKDNENILLFDRGSEDHLVQKLELLASNPSLKEHLIASAKQEVRQYSWSQVGNRLLGIYEEVYRT